jgi:hypothetical protein
MDYPSLMNFRNPNINMGSKDADEFMNMEADVEMIRLAKVAIEKL